MRISGGRDSSAGRSSRSISVMLSLRASTDISEEAIAEGERGLVVVGVIKFWHKQLPDSRLAQTEYDVRVAWNNSLHVTV